MLRGVNKRGPVAARVLHVLTTQRASPTRRAVTNDALQESRRRIQCRLLVGPVPHLEASVIHPLSRGGLFGICLELVPSFYLQLQRISGSRLPLLHLPRVASPSLTRRPLFHAHPSLRLSEEKLP